MIIVLTKEDQTVISELKRHFGDTHDVFVHDNRVALQGVQPNELNANEKAAG